LHADPNGCDLRGKGGFITIPAVKRPFTLDCAFE